MSEEADIINTIEITKILIDEIALEGLQGCNLNRVFDLMKIHQDSLNINVNNEIYQKFLFKRIVNRDEIDFYKLPDSKQSEEFKIINDNGIRGFCSNYEHRHLVNNLIKTQSPDYNTIIKDHGDSLILVAAQWVRNKVLAPSYVSLPDENLTDLEYCVLEMIAKSRKIGVYTTGEGSLSHRFDLIPKQLHYILGILANHEFITKHTVSSQKQRSIIYLRRFEQRTESNLEKLTNFLLTRENYECETSVVRCDLKFGIKQLKNLIALGEKQQIFHRHVLSVPKTDLSSTKSDMSSEDDDEEYSEEEEKSSSSGQKMRQMRILRLNASFLSKQKDDEQNVDDENEEESTQIDPSLVGSLQSNNLPFFSQIFQLLERCGKDGISLKRLGNVFGLDFYKSRRMGANLQSHPEIVTIVKETDKCKAKFQTIVLRKFLTENETSKEETIRQHGMNKPKNIQAVMPERSLRRKQIILDYLTEKQVCTKYEIDREIRRIEELEKQKGQIDSKTTKRLLLQLESEQKVATFEITIRNSQFMAVRLPHIEPTSETYSSFVNGFTRTNSFSNSHLNTSHNSDQSQQQQLDDSTTSLNTTTTQEGFQLTRSYIQSIVTDLHFSFQYAKCYGIVSKLQKSIILHRLAHYILYFYDGSETPIRTQNYNELIEGGLHEAKPRLELFKQDEIELERRVVATCEPTASYQHTLSWKTFIPPLTMKSQLPKNCIYIGDLLNSMPLSVFASIVAVNYKIPGLLSLLKHPYKRHMLVKDLPPQIMAPLIHERRYLQRILNNLQLLASMGLISFVEYDLNKSQAANRLVQSQLIYIHRNAYFRDTTKNTAGSWKELPALDDDRFSKLIFSFDAFEKLLDFWRKLLEVSLNTYKFNVGESLKESKKLRAVLQKISCKQVKLSELSCVEEDLRPLFGDNRGPGGFDSQLYLNSYANWSLPVLIDKNSVAQKVPYIEFNSNLKMKVAESAQIYSELVLPLPFGLYRGAVNTPSKRKNAKLKKKGDESDEDFESEFDEEPVRKRAKLKRNVAKRLRKLSGSSVEAVKKTTTSSIVISNKSLRQRFAKVLVERAKYVSISAGLRKKSKVGEKVGDGSESVVKPVQFDMRRAIWSKEEDDLILLIKIAALYFLPNEKSIQFKIIHQIMNELMPHACANKKIKSFGRRMKVLLRSKANRLFISNQLELCKHNEQLRKSYANVKLKRNTASSVNEQISLYRKFIVDMKKCLSESSNAMDLSKDFKMPESKEKLFAMYDTQLQSDIFKRDSHFTQPTNEYDILSSTLHSAIHSSILINDKNPREYESLKLFEQYSDHQLTSVINTMSRAHNIIAPTKCSEMKKKNITPFSKHVGKAYHISQRYQYKWLNNMPSSVIVDTNKFSEMLNRGCEIDCTDKDNQGMAAYLAHTLDDTNLDVNIEVPNKIWVSKFL